MLAHEGVNLEIVAATDRLRAAGVFSTSHAERTAQNELFAKVRVGQPRDTCILANRAPIQKRRLSNIEQSVNADSLPRLDCSRCDRGAPSGEKATGLCPEMPTERSVYEISCK